MSRAPDALVGKQVHDQRAPNGNLAGKAGVPKAGRQPVVPVDGRRRISGEAHATGGTEPTPTAVYAPREACIR